MIAFATPLLLLALSAPQAGPAPASIDGVDLRLRSVPPVDPAGEAPRQEDPPPKIQDGGVPAGPGLIDFDWLEMDARAGVAVFSSIYHIDPSPRVGIELRAPLTIFTPADNPDGDYFGIFAQLDVTAIKRTIEPKVDKPSGGMVSLTLGLDYAIFRTTTWFLMVRGGFQYATYGGVTDLHDGYAPLAGLSMGLTLSRALTVTLTPEYVRGDSDSIISGLLGLTFDF